jgi:DNA-binding NtrC family response regulator
MRLCRVLFLDDQPTQTEPLVECLRQGGFEIEWTRVETRDDFLSHLTPEVEVILAERSLAHYDALRAISDLRATGLHVPLLVVTGAAGEETALECMREGAADYILKDRLARLPQAVLRALEHRELRVAHRNALSALAEQNGTCAGALALATGITERGKIEERLEQHERMALLGRLAGGVAHHFSNILTIILGHARLILDDLSPNHPHRANASSLLAAAERGAAFTRQLITIGRRQAACRRVLNVNSALREFGEMLERMAGEDILLDLSMRPELWNVRVDPVQLRQILLNLIASARDAMPRGGKVFIDTDNFHLAESAPGQFHSLPPGDYVTLAVTDTGAGMDQDTVSHILDPFHSTKGLGMEGRLGLAMVYGIVRQMGGEIIVESAVGAGTIFRLYLPAAHEPEAASQPEDGSEIPPAASAETVLVVEDDPEVLDLTIQMIQSLGYKVLHASDAKAALEVCGRHPGPVHVLMTDVVMPGLSGPDLAKKVEAVCPGIAVVYASGFPDHPAFDRGPAKPEVEILTKPFTIEQLSQALHAALRRPRKRATILVADDDADVRQVLCQILRNHGYTVLQASNGQEALDSLAASHVDLFITDLVMPDRNGLELIWDLRKNRPGLKVLAITGAFTDLLVAAGKMGAKGILEKPIRAEALLAKVRSLIG